MKVLLTFPSIHYVLKAEKLIKGLGLFTDMVPVPKEISSDCGMALLVREEDLNQITSLLKEKGLPLEGIYQKQEAGFVPYPSAP